MVKEEVVGNLGKEVSILNQLVQASESSFEKLKKAHEKKDSNSFNTLKAELVQAQRRISEYIR